MIDRELFREPKGCFVLADPASVFRESVLFCETELSVVDLLLSSLWWLSGILIDSFATAHCECSIERR